jgi:hypothetical protein
MIEDNQISVPNNGFSSVVEDAKCIYASKANIIMIPALAISVNIKEIANSSKEYFEYVSHKGDLHKIDGLIIEVKDPDVGKDIESLSKYTYNLLRQILEQEHDNDTKLDDAKNEGWAFKIYGEKYFVIVFARLYPATSPRRIIGSTSTFYMFQPFHAFNRKSHPQTGLIPIEAREKIRDLYMLDGRGYDKDLATSLFDGHKLILPIERNSDIIKWWDNKGED